MLIDSIQLSFMDLLDISIVALVIYYVLRLIRGTHAEQMLIGLVVMLILYEAAQYFGLLTVEWIFNQVFSVFIVILVVLFQTEIRKGLMRVAVNPLSVQAPPKEKMVADVVQATALLVQKRWGALIVFERETGLKHLDDSGVKLNAVVNVELMVTLFCPATPLHDGALVVALNEYHVPEIRAARVLLPLANSNDIRGSLGTRHRAAIGLSEQNDALIVVVSEERGEVHLVENGAISEALQGKALERKLLKALSKVKFTEEVHT